MKEHRKLLLIAAMCQGRGIGKNNQLPWNLPKEFQYFIQMTKSTRDTSKKNAVILGRLTWESLPPKFQPMPNRVNIVVTRNSNYQLPDGVYRASSVDEAVAITLRPELNDKVENVWVLGGEQIYREALRSPFCHRIYLTHIAADYDCDTFFPEFNCPGDFKLVDDDERVPKAVQEENGVQYTFKVYERNTIEDRD